MKTNLIKFVAISGNVVFIYLTLYDRLTEIFACTPKQLLGYMVLTALLAVNTYLLVKKTGKVSQG